MTCQLYEAYSSKIKRDTKFASAYLHFLIMKLNVIFLSRLHLDKGIQCNSKHVCQFQWQTRHCYGYSLSEFINKNPFPLFVSSEVSSTWRSERLRATASSAFRLIVMQRLKWNSFSSSRRWRSLYTTLYLSFVLVFPPVMGKETLIKHGKEKISLFENFLSI